MGVVIYAFNLNTWEEKARVQPEPRDLISKEQKEMKENKHKSSFDDISKHTHSFLKIILPFPNIYLSEPRPSCTTHIYNGLQMDWMKKQI